MLLHSKALECSSCCAFLHFLHVSIFHWLTKVQHGKFIQKEGLLNWQADSYVREHFWETVSTRLASSLISITFSGAVLNESSCIFHIRLHIAITYNNTYTVEQFCLKSKGDCFLYTFIVQSTAKAFFDQDVLTKEKTNYIPNELYNKGTSDAHFTNILVLFWSLNILSNEGE